MKKNFYIINNDFDLKRANELNNFNKKLNKKFPLEIYYQLGYYIITPLIIGIFLGLYLDQLFNKKGFFVLIFIFLGAVFTFYNLYRIYKENIKNNGVKTTY